MPDIDVVSLGEPLYEFSQIPQAPGRYLQGFGGDTMNCAIAATRLGARVAYITRLGDDEFGRQFLRLWRDEGLDTSGVAIDPEAHTAVYFITHGATGHVFSYLRKGSAASRLSAADLPLELIERARYFHTSGISQAISENACDAVCAAIEAAKSAGVAFVYDSNLRLRLWPLARAREVITATLAQADYFLLSMEDAEALCGLRDADAIVDWCHRAGAGVVTLKLGAGGVIGSDSTRRERIEGYKVDCVDATGAGDCFAGALLARMSAGDDFWQALRYANAAAALTTTGYGAVAPLPRPEAVRQLMNRG
ncbi:MAG: sugar kinase [Betaproteobacteria bacterium]|nr:sugar kinase [Betaproteobacteria bacterium]